MEKAKKCLNDADWIQTVNVEITKLVLNLHGYRRTLENTVFLNIYKSKDSSGQEKRGRKTEAQGHQTKER